MTTATLMIGTEQRDLIKYYLRIQALRLAEERQESDRKTRIERLGNNALNNSRSGIETELKGTLRKAEFLRVEATEIFEVVFECQTAASREIRRLPFGSYLAEVGLREDLPKRHNDPQCALSQSLEVARDAKLEVDSALQELADLESKAAQVRLLLATGSVAAVTGLLLRTLGATDALLLLPLLLASVIALFRLDHAVSLLDRLISYAEQKRALSAAKPLHSVPRNYFGALTAIRDSTAQIGNPYVQSGTRAAAMLYFTGSATAVVLAAAYALLLAAITTAMIGLVLWFIANILGES